MCDVALDPYTDHGHDGLIIKNKIDNMLMVNYSYKNSIVYKQSWDVMCSSLRYDGW